MERLAFLGAALLCAACSGGTGNIDTSTPDGGVPEGGVPVNLDGGGAPATPPDGASKCPMGACNYQTGAGCSGATSSCIPAVSNGTVVPECSPAGAGTSGAACAQISDCAAGHLCAGGTCRKLCCGGDWTGCDSASEHCIENLAYSDGNGGTLQTGAMLCYLVNVCDPLSPEGCNTAGKTCQIVDPTGATACFAEGTGGAGEPCPCKGGFTCVVTKNGSVCARLCKAVEGGGPPYCQSNEGICTHYTRDPAGVGECSPPTGM